MPACRKCSTTFPNHMRIDGVWKTLSSRRYCLVCSPWGQHNTKILDDTPHKRAQRDANIKKVVAHHRLTKQKAIAHMGGSCEKCGYSRSVRALCFHHRDPTQKDFNISCVTASWERIVVELGKCVLLCSNCHAELHEELDATNM